MAEIVAYISRAEVEGKGAKTGGTNPHKWAVWQKSHWSSRQLFRPEAGWGWRAEQAQRPMGAWVRQTLWRIPKSKLFVHKSILEELPLRVCGGISDSFIDCFQAPSPPINRHFLGYIAPPFPHFSIDLKLDVPTSVPSPVFRQRYHALTPDGHYSRNTFQRRMHPSK